MQNSRPASLRGGGCSRRVDRVPPGRTLLAENSASRPVLSTRAAMAVRVSVPPVLPVRPVPVVLSSVCTQLGGPCDPPPVRGAAGGAAMYPSGNGTQLLPFRNVPCLRSHKSVLKSGMSTPAWLSATFVLTSCM